MGSRGEWGAEVSGEEQVGTRLRVAIQTRTFAVWTVPPGSSVGPLASPGGCGNSLEGLCVLLQEGHSCWCAAGHILVDELNELADEGGQVAGGLPVIL